MIPYIIINGVSSRTINGLLIQSLPPISKPPIRTSVEEIDGRDGDIVEVLGYGAYDKIITIGLRGDYDVDEVIEFFNASGTIIFSNEIDKYYKFAIYEQMDLERLLRFKTATVTMHVQPFKYAADAIPIKWENTEAVGMAIIPVRNTGNIYSKPTITIVGSGVVNVYLENTQILQIALASTTETIIINVAEMNALDANGNFLNRRVTGDYNNLVFNKGVNRLKVEGSIESVKVDQYSRWI